MKIFFAIGCLFISAFFHGAELHFQEISREYHDGKLTIRYTADSAVRDCHTTLQKLLPNTPIRYYEECFSSAVDYNKQCKFIDEGDFVTFAHIPYAFYTNNIRECCAVGITNPKNPNSGMFAHIRCTEPASIKKDLNDILEDLLQGSAIDLSKDKPRTYVVTSFLSQHLWNVCRVLKQTGFTPRAIYSNPMVLTSNNPDFNQADLYEQFYTSNYTEYCNSIRFPRTVYFDPTTGEIATKL